MATEEKSEENRVAEWPDKCFKKPFWDSFHPQDSPGQKLG